MAGHAGSWRARQVPVVIVLLVTAAALGGSYTGGNPMGLFTLLAPPPGSAPDWFLYPEAGYGVALEASVDGRVAAEATVRRQGPVAVGVVEKRLRPAKGG